ncbi:MAG: hydrogenase nickel incorporation protein HypB [bacterium]|nr:hydrogenase nickel incorporation protein HypB [bacterium]MDW8164348.1 hydrogenase nickel incorporation protein HypB [Candidatus Omnitrophota bacterium]
MLKVIRIEKSLFEENEKLAKEVREILNEKNILSFNIMGSPGSGKTLFIEKTIENLKEKFNFAVIEGDVEGVIDAEKFKKFNIPVIQINTGGGCHLDANMVKIGISEIKIDEIDILFVENVGNLICPAEFDIGTEKNIVVSSITEGNDKVLKYPLIFKFSDICILNKIDLLPYSEFDFGKFKNDLKKISPETILIKLSSKTGENFFEWIEYLRRLKKGRK